MASSYFVKSISVNRFETFSFSPYLIPPELGSSFALEVVPYLGQRGNCFGEEIEGSLASDLSQLNSTNTPGLNC